MFLHNSNTRKWATPSAVIGCGRADGDAGNEVFAFEFVARAAVGEAVGKHAVKIVFQDGGHVVPEHRVLAHDGLVAQQGLLFGGGVNAKIGIECGEVADFVVRAGGLQVGDNGFVGNGLLEVGMGEEDECHVCPFGAWWEMRRL